MDISSQRSSDDQPVLVEFSSSGIATVTLNRPKLINAINRQMANDLVAALQQLRTAGNLRVVVIQGAGRGFCSGADLRERRDLTAEDIGHQRDQVLECMALLQELSAPAIASCHGAVIAGGMELALACDIRIASTESRWGLPEVKAAGAFPGGLGPIRLAKMIPGGLARLLVFTGRVITADEARQMGIVDVLCSPESRRIATDELVADILAGNKAGIAAAKRLMVRSDELSIEQAAELSRALRYSLDSSAETKAAIANWVAHRERTANTARESSSE